jgi:hypothetical protein
MSAAQAQKRDGFSWSRIGQDVQSEWVSRSSVGNRYSWANSLSPEDAEQRALSTPVKTWSGRDMNRNSSCESIRPASAALLVGKTLLFEENLPRWRPFVEARKFARSLKLEDAAAWPKWCAEHKADELPKDIPDNPEHVYSLQWMSMEDWLGIRPSGDQAQKDLDENPDAKRRWVMKDKDDRLLRQLIDHTGARFRIHPHDLLIDELTLGEAGHFCGYCYVSLAPRQRRYGSVYMYVYVYVVCVCVCCVCM